MLIQFKMRALVEVSSKGLTNALNNSGKVQMFSTAKLFYIIASIRFAFLTTVAVW